MKIAEIKLHHLQSMVDNSQKNYPTLRKLKVLFNQLNDWAVMNEVIGKDKNLFEYVDISQAENPNKIDENPFLKKDVKYIWSKQETNEYISVVLMMIYSGVRISEILDLKKSDVHLDEHWFFVRVRRRH